MSGEMTFFIRTYGCQMNVRDTESVAMLLVRHGLEPAQDEARADLVLVNTCSVRGKAEDKAIGKLGMLAASKRKRPGRLVGVMGCMVQRRQKDLFKQIDGLDFAVGPRRFSRIPALLDRVRAGGRHLLDIGVGDEDIDTLSDHEEGTVTAFVNILLGCDRRCTYCIVPDVRGPEWSRPAQGVVQEVQRLAAAGVREVTLLGQSVMRYGLRNPVLPEGPPSPRGFQEPFVRLLEMINDETTIFRLRFTSSHPSGCTPELAEAMRVLPAVCPQMHLPLQSGSNAVLKRMRRGYTAEAYLAAVERLRQAVPELAITTDIIVGFPGESLEDFEATRRFMGMVGFDNAFIFKYSPRPGTPAAEWTDDVPDVEKMRRNQVLLQDQDHRGQRINNALCGKVVEVLVEGPSLRNADRWSGRSPGGKIVVFEPVIECDAGEVVMVHIERAMPQTLYGRMVTELEVQPLQESA